MMGRRTQMLNLSNMKSLDSQPIATQVCQFWWQSLSSSFRFPIGYFLTKSVTATQLKQWLFQGLNLLAQARFEVLYMVCDGGSANRSFILVRGPCALGCVFGVFQVPVVLTGPMICYILSIGATTF